MNARKRSAREVCPAEHWRLDLLAQVELLDEIAVSFDLFILKIVEEFSSSTYKFK
jgi:hypothetical protein